MTGPQAPAWAYLVRCADGTLYAGWTTDTARRTAAHNAGRGAKYTRSRRPVRLVYREACASRSAAMAREAALKKLSRAQKEALCAAWAQQQPLQTPTKEDLPYGAGCDRL